MMNHTEKIAVAVVGCGNISKCHLKALSEMDNVQIVAVCDVVPERANVAAEQYAVKPFYDYNELLNECELDCVHICTPHYLHVEMAVAALKRNINVLCEKPAAISSEGVEALQAAQKLSSAVYGVCFQNRYNDSIIKAKKLIEGGRLGKVIAAQAQVNWFRDNSYYNDEWHGTLEKEGGGVLINQAIHTEDLLRYLVGSDIKSVIGHVFNDCHRGAIEVEDGAFVRFGFENGAVGIFNATNCFSINATPTIELFFEKGSLKIEGSLVWLTEGDALPKVIETESSAATVGKNYWGNGHGALIADFYKSLQSGSAFSIDTFEGGKSIKEISAIYESSRLDKEILI